jgi:hypothetical protein
LLGELAGVGMSLDAWFRSDRRELDLLEIKIKMHIAFNSTSYICCKYSSNLHVKMIINGHETHKG